jgi:DNA replication and repair protein RecF
VYLDTLTIQNFRNLQAQSIHLGPRFTYIYGANGAGKTAILEAIYLLARGRSFRTHKVSTVVSHGAASLLVRGNVVSLSGQNHQLAISKARSGKTELRLDGKTQARASALAQQLPLQLLMPDSGQLIMGGPAHRRAFMDWGVFHVERQFVDVARQYRRVILQRNAWLKSLEGKDVAIEKDPWFSQLLELAHKLSRFRAVYVEQFAPIFGRTLRQLSPELNVHLAYDWGGLSSLEEHEKKLTESWLRDVKFGVTHRGPHRADLTFRIGDETAADVVSRGQAKLIACAALLSQAELLREHSGAKSVFLIDDFGAELDSTHWRLFMETLKALDCQVIATSTEPYDHKSLWGGATTDVRLFHVEHGLAQEVGLSAESSED